MEGRKRSRALTRTVYSVQKRLLAFTLAAAMILTNVGADMNTAYASSSESVTFSMSGSQLVDAIDEAIANGNEVTAEDLDFTNGKIAEFEKLFFGEGKIFEVFPDPEGGSMDAELRVFVRLPEDADDMYMVTGDEEVIFLYVNNGEDSISCTTEITRMDDGVEKVKKTKRVTVKSFEAAFGDEEINIISKPVEETTAPEETQGPANGETTAPVESESQTETSAPVDGETTDVPDETTTAPDATTAAPDGTTEAPDTTTSADETTTAPDETSAAPEESQTEEPETSEAVEEKTPETDAPETDAPETEAPESKEAEPLASIVRHYAPVVAENEDGNAEDATEAKKETEAKEPEKEKEEEPKETEAPTKEETEAPTKEEATEAPTTEATTEPTGEPSEEATTAPDSESTTPGTDESTDEPTAAPTESNGESTDADESSAVDPSESASVPETSAQVSTEETTAAAVVEDKVNKASDTDLVGMGYCSTAKAYTTTINALKALDDFDGYKVSYAFYPEASGRIVDGARGVEEGNTLVFGVKNQIGYAVESVSANGEIFEADSVTDNEDGSQTAWYTVPEIYEEQEVEVYMTETGEHPEFSAELLMDDGTIISLYAPEGVLPANVKAVASVVTGIEDVVKENVEAQAAAEGEAKEVVTSLSYNIDLLDASGHKLDDGIWNGAVLVTFTGAPIEEMSKDADAVEIVYVATTKEDEPQAKVSAQDIVAVETVSEVIEALGDSKVDEISFNAEHFSVYTLTFTNPMFKDVDLKVQVVNMQGKGIGKDKSKEYSLFNGYNKNISTIAEDVRSKMGLTDAVFVKATIGNNVTNPSINYFERDRNAIFAYDSEGNKIGNVDKSSQIYFWFNEKDNIIVSFNANSGKGKAPDNIQAKAGSIVQLPDHGYLTKNGYTFLGWSVSPTANDNVDGHKKALYPAGAVYEVPQQNQELFAIWGRNNESATFFIGKFGKDEIPNEPSSIQDSKANYTKGIYIEGALKVARFVSDSSGVDDYLNDNKKPTKTQITQKCEEAGLSYDSTTDKIVWYVIKHENDGWHVDGVIVPKENVILQYDANCFVFSGNLPSSAHGVKDSEFIIEAGKNLKREGWNFKCWNTQRDGQGTDYYPGQSIKLDKNITLFAKWVPDKSITKELNYIVEHRVQGEEKARDAYEVSEHVWINAEDFLSIQNINLEEYEGYIYSSNNVNLSLNDNKTILIGTGNIEDGGKIVVTYVKNDADTRKKSYTVEHWVEGEGKARDTETVTKEVWALDTTLGINDIDLHSYKGYKYGSNDARLSLNTEKTGLKGNGTIAVGGIIKITYVENEPVSIKYIVEMGQESIGSVENDEDLLKPVSGNPKGSKAIAIDGYKFIGWTKNESSEFVSTDVEFKPSRNADGIYEAATFIAHFVVRGDLPYEVNYYYDGIRMETVQKNDATFNEVIPYISESPHMYQEKNYVLESVDGAGNLVTTNPEQNKVNVFYVLDLIGEKDPDKPDGIPDKYQVTFTYIANENGSVSGAVKEVVTRPQNDDGTYDIDAAVSPKANVTVTPANQYAFYNWSVSGNVAQSYDSLNSLRGATFTQDTTFVANFRYVEPYNPGGGGNGGGTSGGGGNRYNPPSGGPGATTINPEDVPLAQLPGAPVDTTMIDDGEIPLAALPKTGQNSVKTTFTMMMSGIFLVLTALSKKRKEEDS